MPETLTQIQVRFLQRYLGGRFETDGAGKDTGSTAQYWQTAKDKVDGQLRSLSDRLRKSAIPEVANVANEVETLLEPLRVKLVVALRNYDAAPTHEEARTDAKRALDSAEAWLNSDNRVSAVDTNPWGVPVSVAATLGEALDGLQREIGG